MDKEEFRVNELVNAYRKNDVKKINLMKDVNLNCQDILGRTPLMNATFKKEWILAHRLINAGVNLNIQDYQGLTALSTAIGVSSKPITKLLINSGADLNIQDTNGNTALFKMIYKRDWENAKILINEHSVDLEHKNNQGNTVLTASICVGSIDGDKGLEITVLLINKGANINAQSNDGWSALMSACRDTKFKTSEMLIERGADYNLVNKQGQSARDIAYKAENCAGPITALIESIELTRLCDQEETPVLSLGQPTSQIVAKRVKSQVELENELLMAMIDTEVEPTELDKNFDRHEAMVRQDYDKAIGL